MAGCEKILLCPKFYRRSEYPLVNYKISKLNFSPVCPFKKQKQHSLSFDYVVKALGKKSQTDNTRVYIIERTQFETEKDNL